MISLFQDKAAERVLFIDGTFDSTCGMYERFTGAIRKACALLQE